jgi:hypothetical protein
MKRIACAFGVCFLTLLLGCSKALDDPVDPGDASTALQTALDAWKQGDAYGDLEKRHPPIYFREPEWEAGKKLVNFTLGKAGLMGRQGRCLARLSLVDRSGKATQREVSYLIDTTPQVVIVRELLGP